MEGLIPMVYRSLMKNKTRRQYECLSSGAPAQTYNIADFYIKEDDHDHHHDSLSRKDQYDIPGLRGAHHRRYNSVHVVDGASRGTALEEDDAAGKLKQLVRYKSHRMFSCVTGA